MRNLTDEERSTAVRLGVDKDIRGFAKIVHLIGEALHKIVDR